MKIGLQELCVCAAEQGYALFYNKDTCWFGEETYNIIKEIYSVGY